MTERRAKAPAISSRSANERMERRPVPAFGPGRGPCRVARTDRSQQVRSTVAGRDHATPNHAAAVKSSTPAAFPAKMPHNGVWPPSPACGIRRQRRPRGTKGVRPRCGRLATSHTSPASLTGAAGEMEAHTGAPLRYHQLRRPSGPHRGGLAHGIPLWCGPADLLLWAVE
jgi:hypothetical protein